MRWSSTSRAIAPEVHSHRDARRIGSNRARGRTLARLCCFLRLSSPVPPCGFPIPATLIRQLTPAPVPSGGWLGSGGALPSTWRFRGLFEAFASGRCPLRAALPSAAGSEFFVPLRLVPSLAAWLWLRFAIALPRLHSNLPITARHSLHLRFARLDPKTSPGVFSDAAAGIAAIPIRLNFPFSFQRLGPKKSVEFFPLDTGKLRPKSESAQAKSGGVIHNAPYRLWTNPGEAVEG